MSVSEQIIKVLDALCEKFGLVVDWTNANITPYLTELCSRICKYEIATSIFYLVIGIIMLAGSIIYFGFSWKNPIDWDTYDMTTEQFNGGFSIVVLAICGGVGIGMICTQIIDIMRAIYIPELTIIDAIKDLTSTITN